MGVKGRGGIVLLVVLVLALLLGCQNLRRNEPPVASFELSADEVYVGETVIFDASSSFDPDGAIVSYEWDFGDDSTGQGKVVSHAYTQPGEYKVTLTVRDERGGTASAQGIVCVRDPEHDAETPPAPGAPVARFTFSPPNPVVGEEVWFDASGSYDPDGYIVTYFWDFGDGDIGEGVEAAHIFVEEGIYTVVLEVEDDMGLIGRATTRITVRPGESLPALKKAWNPATQGSLGKSVQTWEAKEVGERIWFNPRGEASENRIGQVKGG